MMRIIQDNIALGIDWETFETKAEAKRKLVGAKLKYLSYMAEGVTVQGVVEHAGWRAKIYSGAQLVALRNETIVVYHALPDGQVWVCAAQGGRPVIGFDRICKVDEGNRLLADALNMFSAAIRVGDMSGSSVGLMEYIDLVPRKQYAKALLKSTAAPVIMLGLIVGAMALCGVGAMGVKLFLEHRQSGLEAQQQEAQQRAQQLAQIKHQKELQEAVAKAREEVLDGVSPSDQMAVWHTFLSSLPITEQGWYPLIIKCEPMSCEVHWERYPQALPSAGHDLPGAFVSVDPEGVTTRFDMPEQQIRKATEKLALENYMKDMAAVTFGLTMKTNPPNNNVLPKLPSQFQPNESQEVIGSEGTFELVSDSLLVINDFTRKLDKPGVRLTNLSITGFSGGRRTAPVIVSGAYRVAK